MASQELPKMLTSQLAWLRKFSVFLSPTAPGTPLPLVLLGKLKNALLSTFLFLDQIVWLHRSGIYKNKERAEIIGRVSAYRSSKKG
ncbi:putative peroxisomal biogenesis factor 11 [Helianthus debilis subsp. tardiflorus]